MAPAEVTARVWLSVLGNFPTGLRTIWRLADPATATAFFLPVVDRDRHDRPAMPSSDRIVGFAQASLRSLE